MRVSKLVKLAKAIGLVIGFLLLALLVFWFAGTYPLLWGALCGLTFFGLVVTIVYHSGIV